MEQKAQKELILESFQTLFAVQRVCVWGDGGSGGGGEVSIKPFSCPVTKISIFCWCVTHTAPFIKTVLVLQRKP